LNVSRTAQSTPSGGEADQQPTEPSDRLRQRWKQDGDEAVTAHFELQAGEHDAALGRSLDMSVRQPVVQRYDRQLDAEADQEGEEDESRGQWSLRQRLRRDDSRKREAVGLHGKIEREKAEQHGEAAGARTRV